MDSREFKRNTDHGYMKSNGFYIGNKKILSISGGQSKRTIYIKPEAVKLIGRAQIERAFKGYSIKLNGSNDLVICVDMGNIIDVVDGMVDVIIGLYLSSTSNKIIDS